RRRAAPRLRRRLDRYRPRRRHRRLRPRPSGEGHRLRLARQAPAGRALEGHHRSLLRRVDQAFVLQLLLERRPPGADGDPALPRGLRRRPRRRAGVVDGVAEDPRRCKFDPASIACPAGTDGPSCLTPPQVGAVRKIMQGPRNPRTGGQIYPGYFTSAAGEAASWPAWITGPPVAGA